MRGRRALILGTVVVLLILLLDFLSGGGVRGGLRMLESSVWGMMERGAGALAHVGIFKSREALIRENETLRAQLLQMQTETAVSSVLQEENARLRDVARVAAESIGTTARIISSPYASAYGTFLIGAGARDGIQEGDLVLSGEDGFVLGRVASVDTASSLVAAVFAPGHSTQASIHGADVSVTGWGASGRASVSRDVPVVEEDVVRSFDYENRVIGTVASVQSHPASAEQEVFIALPFSLTKTPFVYVVHSL